MSIYEKSTLVLNTFEKTAKANSQSFSNVQQGVVV